MQKRITVIVNAVARGNVSKIIERLEALADPKIEMKIVMTTGPQTATELTLRDVGESDLVIAVGGDGTVGEVAAALKGNIVPLAIVPAGSTNIIAREYGIPTSAEKAMRLIFGNHSFCSLDMGSCNERPFLHMAGIGFDAHMFAATNQRLKRRAGWVAYFPAALQALREPPRQYGLTADGRARQFTSPLILVANGRSILTPVNRIHPAISPHDGLLDVLVFTADTPLEVLRTLSRFSVRGLARSPFVEHFHVRSVAITSDSPVPVEVDGDVVSITPVKFTAMPSSIMLMVPSAH